MPGSGPYGIGAVLDEHANDLEVAPFRGPNLFFGGVPVITDVGVRTALEEEQNHRFVSGIHREMQSRAMPGVPLQRSALTHYVGMLVEQLADAIHVSLE